MKNLLLLLCCSFSITLIGQSTFQPLDVYDLEFATDPQFSPDGKQIIYSRVSMDIMTDRRISNLWTISPKGNNHRPLTTGNYYQFSAKWSPDGSKIAYLSNESGSTQIHLRWMDTGMTAKISNLRSGIGSLSWSPDGKWLAFVMSVKKAAKGFADMPQKPEGAKWANAPKYIDKLLYRSDGRGYLEESYSHIFVLPIEGGTPQQISSGDFNHSSPTWSSDGKSIYCSANRAEDWEYQRNNSEIYSIDLKSKQLTALTDRYGPDYGPVLSPNGKQLAYLGYDDKKMGYHHTHLNVMDVDGKNKKVLTDGMDFSFGNIQWNKSGDGLYFQFDEKGSTKIGFVDIQKNKQTIAEDLGGASIGRPYDGGDFDVHGNQVAFMSNSDPSKPAELAITNNGSTPKQLTDLNADILMNKTMGKVEEIWYKSSHDGLDIQGWMLTPPNFDPAKKYPLILEIHGGPFANYGDRFSPELQLFASKGYVVLYTNPRGSTSYGLEFANLIHHNYPSNDYEDLISGVDAVIAKGYIDTERLFVTGGSGGGVLTSWIIGKTDRFAAAVVAKPVINWYSWALTADIAGVVDSWFPGKPWDHQDHYMKRSPISLVGNVKTPTMLLTGEEDYRTPMSESEQYYQALKMQKIPSALVRIQEASHGIASRPSNLLAKVAYITAWFEKYDPAKK